MNIASTLTFNTEQANVASLSTPNYERKMSKTDRKKETPLEATHSQKEKLNRTTRK